MHPIIIIGSGLAGYTVAREFRKVDKQTPLVIVTADDGGFYSKPMLSNALAAGKTAAALAMKTSQAMAAELSAEILTHASVVSIDAAAHQLTLNDRQLNYSKLVLALGADPIRLPLAGDGTDEILSVNDLGGYARFREKLQGRRRVAILGAGLIGCEFANDLLAGKHEVDVIDIAAQPLGRLLPPEPAHALREALSEAGVRWHLGVKTLAVNKAGDALRLQFEIGETLDTDLVLSAIGLAPRTALARAAGLSVNRGIVVDARLKTSAADIYALGDCAEFDGAVLPYVLPIMSAARVLGPLLAGNEGNLRYPVMPVVIKTPALPLVVCPPASGAKGQWQTDTQADGIVARFVDESGQLAGFALSGAATARRQQLSKEMTPG